MISTCIRHPERHPLLIIREWQIKFCDGNHCAAALLSFFEHWHNWRLDMQIKAAQANRIAQNHGQEGNQDDSLYQFHNAEEIERGLLGLYRRDAIRQARKLLIKKGAISEHGNPSERYKFDKTTYFIFYPEICQRFIDEYYSEAHSSTYAESRTSRAENRNSSPNNRNSPPENRISINKITSETTTQGSSLPSGEMSGSRADAPRPDPAHADPAPSEDVNPPKKKPVKQERLDTDAGEAIAYLNEKAGKHYRQIKNNLKYPRARLREGFELPDLKLVVDFKAAGWKDDPEMDQYLRPQTVFNEKFESYLQAAKRAKENPVSTPHAGPGSNRSHNLRGSQYGTDQRPYQSVVSRIEDSIQRRKAREAAERAAQAGGDSDFGDTLEGEFDRDSF